MAFSLEGVEAFLYCVLPVAPGARGGVEIRVLGRILAKNVPKTAKCMKKLLPVKGLAIMMASSVNELMATTALCQRQRCKG